MDKVAVVILNWNGEKMLRRFLPGVLAHTCGTVYVADNASTDDSLDLLTK
ncbi:MAG: glycosyltransferase family 2 protein, partial [Paraprevotella sp.]|nr:glycosyltransferase family 2 protein [Paraprevotella sp.]